MEYRRLKPPDSPMTIERIVVWKGPTSIVRNLKPPKYGRAKATTGIIREPAIVSVTKS